MIKGLWLKRLDRIITEGNDDEGGQLPRVGDFP
jgi:hypothetical protein